MVRIGMFSSSRLLALSGLAAALIAGGQAQAAPRYMGGTGGIANASVSGNNTWERGPVQVSTIVANDSPSTDMTAAGNAFTIPVGAMALTGMNLRFFPTFVFVAQNSFSFMTTLPQAERLENGQGAAAIAPINFCPPKDDPNPLDGNLNCVDWANPGDPNYRIRMGIDRRRTAGGDPIGGAFGGTLRLARNVTSSNVWFAKPPYPRAGQRDRNAAGVEAAELGRRHLDARPNELRVRNECQCEGPAVQRHADRSRGPDREPDGRSLPGHRRE